MTDFFRLSRFGMTCKPLTDDLGEELLTLYRAGFPVKTLAQLEKAQELKESDQECGEKWRGSFVKYDPDTLSWRTHQCSLLGDLEPFSETWPQWGLMRDGECWEQRTLEQTIRGTESGLLPNGVDTFHTPNCTGLDGGSNSRKALKKRMQTWPTPRTKGMCGGSGSWAQLKANTTIEEARAMGAGNGGKLNPMWVEWLMGWPIGWTDLKPLETGKCPSVQQQLGKS
jgi:DNA (cytosine-5)-methyltransferase 1